MTRTGVVVVGAGQAGLAVSHLLAGRGIDHVVLERGRAAQAWAAHRWESLRLLTPNWMSRLPGRTYDGADPDGFMSAGEVAGYLTDYARPLPVVQGAQVLSVRRRDRGYRVESTAGSWVAPVVVVATGACQQPNVPRIAGGLHPSVRQLTPDRYRNPDSVPDGEVLVVGAGATGVQLADELAAAGRDVVLAVGRHSRMPRRYRDRDIMWWLDALGTLHRPLDQSRRRPAPSLQLRADRPLDLDALAGRGVRLAGRLDAVDGRFATFVDDLTATAAEADARQQRLLTRIDSFAAATGVDAPAEPHPRPTPTTAAPGRLAVRTLIWATGYRRNYPWLHVPVLDRTGEITQVDGATPAPGLFVVGLPNQTRRSSTFLDGVRFDAELVVDAAAPHLSTAAGRLSGAIERRAS